MAETTAKTTTRAKKPAAKKPAAPKKKAAPAAKAAAPSAKPVRAGFSAALEKAKASTAPYREKLAANSGEWVEEARELSGQAKDRAKDLAVEGKAKASDAISSLGKVVADSAGTIDDKLGVKYGDYARTAARTMQETAAKIEAKSLDEIGEDAKQFVRKSPGLAIGIAAVVGFLISRLFRSSED